MQYHNYIFEVYNKPNRLKIGWKLSNNVMNKRAACGKMAAMWQRRSPLASSAGESSSVYIYLYIGAFTLQYFSHFCSDIVPKCCVHTKKSRN